MHLKQARVLLTGATGGLGQALAQQLVQAGAQVLLSGRDGIGLAALQATLGAATSCVAADLTTSEGVAALQAAAQQHAVNVLVNNAGISTFGLFDEQPWRDIEQVLATNLLAPLRLTQALLPLLKTQQEAAVVNIGSMFGSLPFAGFAAYSSAKAGLRGFSHSLRRELADTQITVIYIAPRAIDTALNSAAVNALNRALGNASDSPQRVAWHIVQALQNKRPELHIGFPERLFATLHGLAPRLIDQGLAGKLAAIKKYARKEPPASRH